MAVDKLLFICSANLVRSPTAEHVARLKGYLARSAGTDFSNNGEFCVNPLTREHLDWATKVICMAQKHVQVVQEMGGSLNPIECWDLEDTFHCYMHPALVEICVKRIPDAREFVS